MALRGTIDAFPIADVARLLARTGQSGTLSLSGNRGSARLEVVDGRLGGGCTSSGLLATDASDVIFDMLQFDDGEFAFDASAEAGAGAGPVDGDHDHPPSMHLRARSADEVLDEVAASSTEWTDMSAIVGSLDRRVDLVDELAGEDVVLDAAAWRVVRAVGSAGTVRDAARQLAVGDLSITRSIAALIERQLVVLGDEVPAERATDRADERADDRPADRGGVAADSAVGVTVNGVSTSIGEQAHGFDPGSATSWTPDGDVATQPLPPESPPALPHRRPASGGPVQSWGRGGELDYDPWSDPSLPSEVAAQLAGTTGRPSDVAFESSSESWDGGESSSESWDGGEFAVEVGDLEPHAEWSESTYGAPAVGDDVPWRDAAVDERSTVSHPDEVLAAVSWSGDGVAAESWSGAKAADDASADSWSADSWSADSWSADSWFGQPSFDGDPPASGSERPMPIFTSDAFLPQPHDDAVASSHSDVRGATEWADATADADVGLWWDAAVPDADPERTE